LRPEFFYQFILAESPVRLIGGSSYICHGYKTTSSKTQCAYYSVVFSLPVKTALPRGTSSPPLLGGFFVQQQRGYSWSIGQHNLKYQ